MKKALSHILLFLLIPVMVSCGYRLGDGPVDVPGGVKSVAVPVFENLTREPEMGVVCAEALRTEILRRGTLQLKSAGKAAAVLRGRVEDVSLEPLSFDEIGYVSAYMARLTVSVQLLRSGDVLWRADGVERFEQILITDQPLDNRVRRRFALEKTAADLMEQLHTMMIEGF